MWVRLAGVYAQTPPCSPKHPQCLWSPATVPASGTAEETPFQHKPSALNSNVISSEKPSLTLPRQSGPGLGFASTAPLFFWNIILL